MLQAVADISRKLPNGKAGENNNITEPRQSAQIIDLHDFFAKPPAKTLQEAKERICRDLPPKPDFANMSDWESVVAIMDWDRMRLYVYETAIFG